MPLAAAGIVVDCKREDNDASVAHFAIFLDSPRIDFSRSSLASRSGDNFVHNFRLDFSYKLPSKVSPGAATILPFLFYYFFVIFFFGICCCTLFSFSLGFLGFGFAAAAADNVVVVVVRQLSKKFGQCLPMSVAN